uniref:Uncharacterized protein n=1 Tax=Tanacetum cinerariifolium TaxID=118510 RepID=A0A699J7E1_TANCI|nr:hypothetical protein [Tanacetum cinerariifolium]
MDAQITVNVVLHGGKMLPIQKDEREESIQEGLDLLILLAYMRHDLLMDDDLYECLMGIAGKENVEGETVSKATDFVLGLAEREWSSDDWELDLGNSLRCLYISYCEGYGVNEDESEAYDIGRDGLVRVARVYGEVGMLAQAEMGYSFRIWVSRFLRATPSSDGDI